TAALAHVDPVAPAAVGTAALVIVFAPLWLSARATTAWLVVLGLSLLPSAAPTALQAGSTVATVVLLTLTGRHVAALGTEVGTAQASTLRQVSARDEEARASQARQAELAQRLQHAATHDPLTGLLNRNALTQLLDASLAAGRPAAVLVMSLTGFRQVNDRFGAAGGDEALLSVGRRLTGAARGSDLVARLSGDEFAVLLPGLNEPEADTVGSRLLAVLDDPVVIAEQAVLLRARGGRACGDQVGSGRDLLRHAETAARGATAGGPVRVFTTDSQVDDQECLASEADLHRALLADEMRLVYQPLVSAQTGRIVSLEALVRWHHPQRGTVPPDEFIGLAERTGLIVPLGLRVLQLACAQLRRWSEGGATHITVAVNVSARQLLEPNFVEQVRTVLWGSGVDPHAIVLELTESLLVEDSEAAVAVLWQLRALGVKLALDDFGTGYSSLGRLGELPIDELKIDKSFTDRLGASHLDSATLVTAAVAMGHGLGLTVVTEGVETPAQAAFLAGVGCDLLQGYLLSKPLPAEALGPLLHAVLLPAAGSIPAPRAEEPVAMHVPAVLPRLPR
nr:bifunctional diguanylate cyclase/phosphodiesterase [Actinomycetota bacterium]